MASRGDESKEEDKDQGEPLAKRLRLSDSDVTVVLHYEEDDGTEAKKEYQMYAHILANMSPFFDASLSVDMKEKKTRVVELQAVTPKVFVMAMQFQQDMKAARAMTAEEALQVVDFYHMYDFEGGVELCDQVLADYLQKHLNYSNFTPPDDLDVVVDAMATADKLNLKQAKQKAIEYVESRLRTEKSSGSPYGATMFTVGHIEKLHPMFKQGFFNGFLRVDNLASEEVESPLFPRFFVMHARDRLSNLAPNSITVCGTLSATGKSNIVDGKYVRGKESIYNPDPSQPESKGIAPDGTARSSRSYRIQKSDLSSRFTGNWVIMYKRDDIRTAAVLRECPNSRNFPYPPKEPWLPMDKHGKVKPHQWTPKISYEV